MAVMADLLILQSQQEDSVRKLQQARAIKQRRQEQQATLETKLDQLKYQNGQQRANIQRAHKLLSEGQRQLQTTRMEVGKAGDELREFDQKLKFLIEIKSSLIAHHRTHDSLLENLHIQVQFLVEVRFCV